MKKIHLTIEQRYEIRHQKEAAKSQAEVARQLGKDKLVVRRELKRNKNNMGGCKANYAIDFYSLSANPQGRVRRGNLYKHTKRRLKQRTTCRRKENRYKRQNIY